MDAISNYVNMLEITLLVILFSADLSHMDYLCATACCAAAAADAGKTPAQYKNQLHSFPPPPITYSV
jgi:hypothetical protein